MLRTLFILLTAVAAILAFMWELYLAVAALLVLAAGLIIANMLRRRRVQDSYVNKKSEEDLQALGIMEIRPKQGAALAAERTPSESSRAPARRQAERQAPRDRAEQRAEQLSRRLSEQVPAPPRAGDGERPAPERPVEEHPIEERPAEGRRVEPQADQHPAESEDAADGAVRVVGSGGEGSFTIRRKSPSEGRPRREVLEATLGGLQAAVGATTVCLLRQEEPALRYHIEAIVSKNHYVRSQAFTTREPLLTPSMLGRAVTVRRVGAGGVDAEHLGYYIEPIAVRQVAVAPVAHADDLTHVFLVVDSMDEDGVGSGRQRALIARYAELVAALLDPRDVPIPDDLDAEDEAEVLRPRREIIEEEMAQARADDRPLSLALVYLVRAEAVAEAGPDAIAEAEAALGDALQEIAAPYRVERFGELTYGVFVPDEDEAVEAWAVDVQRALDAVSGPLEGGVAVGIAVLQDRHATPDAFRADATEALRAAYESGAATILA